MAHDYRTGTLATAGPRILGAVGGLKDAPDGPTYTEAKLDDAGNLRTADQLAPLLLEQLVEMNEKLALLIALLDD